MFGGKAKLQWKVDWAMRWFALGVDYEMSGKDLTDSVTQSGRIVRALGGRMPEVMIYELFLDDNGEKISKSKGNGFTFEEWLRYGTEESLGFYVFREPKSAKSLHVGVIPRAVDEYWQFRAKYPEQPLEQQLGNPVAPVRARQGAATASAAGDLRPAAQPRRRARAAPTRSRSGPSSSNYVPSHRPAQSRARRAGRPARRLQPRFRRPDAAAPRARAERGRRAARARWVLAGMPETPRRSMQTEVYEIGKREGFESLRDWFKALYETLLGSARARAWAASSRSTASPTPGA